MAAPTTTPAGWYADPTRRHQTRYWDGEHWTAQVSDAGVTSVETPIGPWLAPATATAPPAPPVPPTMAPREPAHATPQAQSPSAEPTGPAVPRWGTLSPMTDTEHYVLEIHLGTDAAPVRVELTGCSIDDAEAKRQALATEIEHAVEIEAPLIYVDETGAPSSSGTPVDPTLVTSVDLVAPPWDEQ